MASSAEPPGSSTAILPGSLARAGFNAVGVLDADDYDARVPPAWQSDAVLPGARSVFVLACGGGAFGAALADAPEWRRRAGESDPVDRFCERIVDTAASEFGGVAAYAHRARGGRFADFVGLGEAAGLGAPSRLGLLLHPDFGPWLSIRALLLTERRASPTPRRADFTPCSGCSAPCEAACPVAAPAPTGFLASRCAGFRRAGRGCADRCDARRACVVHPEHAFAEPLDAHFSAASLRWLGG